MSSLNPTSNGDWSQCFDLTEILQVLSLARYLRNVPLKLAVIQYSLNVICREAWRRNMRLSAQIELSECS